MASQDYWAEAPLRREQIVLFSPTLDEMIAADDPVRLLDEVLRGLDWSAWEAKYPRKLGQPPIHPAWWRRPSYMACVVASAALVSFKKPVATGSTLCGWWKHGRSTLPPSPNFAPVLARS